LTAQIADYFVRAAGLDNEYEPIPLASIDSTELKDSDQALVFRNHAQIDTLLKGKFMTSVFARNLISIR
jgi:hypothetical protein